MVNPKDYTVGWICAIPTEFTAAQAFLDIEHNGPDHVSPHSVGYYTLGKIENHNVVITSLPAGEYGTSSAATVARDMVLNFPNVKIGLMVGVGGGVPTRHDIRLGDVVVSTPGGGSGGIFQYDFGKTIQDKKFRQTGFHNQPPSVLLTACNGLKAHYDGHGHQLQEAIDTALNKTPKLREKYQRPDPSTDRLYQATVVHPNSEVGCAAACGDDLFKLKSRPKRTDKDDDPTIHYGLIASGNQLMKDASIRDNLAEERDVLCFEMEAAGLVNHFPCIIIRGICDYSDSHKNKNWQGYAAMTAAAYAKDLLRQIAPTKVEAEIKIADILDSVGQNVKYLESEHKQSRIEGWLSPSDPSTNYNKAIRQRHENSGTWFLNGDAFRKWKTQRNSFLWLYGFSGCGKTVLSSTIIENLENTFPTEPVIYFYFDFKDISKRTLDDMIRSLIGQLCGRNNSNPSWQKLVSFYSKHSTDGKRRSASPESLSEFLLEIIEQVKEIWIIIDALDECGTNGSTSREKLLSWMSELRNPQKRNVHLLVTSRPNTDIENGIKKFADESNMIPIESSVVTVDILAYIDKRLMQDRGFLKWREQRDVQDQLKAELMKHAGGMFRLAACQLDSLADCVDYDELMNTLISLPNTLTDTYKLAIRSIPSIRKGKAIRILQFLIFSDRALRIHEAVDALAINMGTLPRFDPRSRMPDPRDITTLCSSLVVVAPAKGDSHSNDHKHLEVQIAHSSVKEYLMSNQVDKDISQYFKEATARASIARVCLVYLSHLDPKVPAKETRRSFPLAEYCARYWMSHAAAADDNDETLQGLINDFFRSESFTACYNLYRPDLPWETAPDMRRDGPAPPLYYAALGGFSNAVESLLSRGDDINAQGGYYGNALQAASFQGHEKVVELLLNKGVDVNAQVGRYGTALYAASIQGHEKVVELLLSSGADVGAQGGIYGTALYVASLEGHGGVIELLLNKGADVNTRSEKYGTPLYAASYSGDKKLVEALLSNGADVNAQCGSYGTALQAASYGGYKEVVEMLLSKGADVNAQGGVYTTALQAASYKGHEKVVDMLLSKGADVKAQGAIFGTALHAASYSGHKKLVEMLLSKGADVNAQGGSFGTALQAASYGGYKEVVEMLLSKGADVNAQGGVYTTALQAASYKGHEKVVDMLLSKGADVKAQGAIFGTALHAASYSGHKKLVEMLLSKGADVNTRDGKYGTAVYAASVRGHTEVIELLLSRMGTQFSRKWHEADFNRRRELSGPPIINKGQPLVDGLPPTRSDSKGGLPPTLSDSKGSPPPTCSDPKGLPPTRNDSKEVSPPTRSDPKEGLPPTRGDSKESSSQTHKGFSYLRKKKAKLGEILNINSDKGEKTSNGQGDDSSSIPRESAGAAPVPSVQSLVDTIVVDPVVDYALDIDRLVDDVSYLVPPADDDLYSDRAVDDPQYFYREDSSSTSDPDVDDVLHLSDPGVNEILYSDIGIAKLCDRLKQSIVSAKEFAHFCLGRSKIETERKKSLERICKSTGDEVRRPEGRQDSYVKGIQDIMKIFEQMADHGHNFSWKLTQIQTNLNKLAEDTERKRKDIRQLGLAEEKRIQDAERQKEKAKEKYYRLAHDLYLQKRSPKASSNLHFTLSGPKSTGQFEDDLNNKVELADSEYQAKVVIANDMRRNHVLTLRPNVVKSLLSSISEVDTALKRSIEELAAEQELLISRDQMTVVPTNENPILRNTVAQIDNVKDFRNHILSFSSEVPKVVDIKYERHPVSFTFNHPKSMKRTFIPSSGEICPEGALA